MKKYLVCAIFFLLMVIFWYFLPVNIENQKDGLIIKEVYEQLEKRFLKMPNHYTVKGCNDFEKYVAENFDKSIIPNSTTLFRVDFDSHRKKFSVKKITPSYEGIDDRLGPFKSFLKKLKFKSDYDFCFFVDLGDVSHTQSEIGKKIHKIPYVCADRLLIESNLEDAILIPDYFLIKPNYELTIKAIKRNLKKKKYLSRLDVAGWRGAQSVYWHHPAGYYFNLSKIGKFPRLDLVLFSAANPDYVDAKFTSYDQLLSPGEEGQKYKEFMLKTVGFPSPFVPFEEMVKYQYNISIDGCVSAWARTPWILFTKSVLLYHSLFETFYTPFLKPYVHYVPIKSDMSDLKEKIDELRANPELYKKIVENGAQFAEEILSPQTIKDYWLKVLTAISKRFCPMPS